MSCCIPNCPSHDKYAKISSFKVPLNIVLRSEWENVLGIPLSNNSRVCRNHFKTHDVIDTWESGNGINKYTVCLKRPRLRDGAIPVNLYIVNNNESNILNEKINNIQECPNSEYTVDTKDIIISINKDHCYISKGSDSDTLNKSPLPKRKKVEQITLFQSVMSNMKLLNIPVKWFYDTDHTEVGLKNKEFFGIIRQVAGPNDHPSTPTFLQLYRMLSVYSLIKPPKTGNCTIFEDNIPIITITDLKDVINDPTNSSDRINKIEKLKEKINYIVDKGCWDADDVFTEHNYSNSTVFDCIVYYLAGYIAKQLVARTKCESCKIYLKNMNTSSTVPAAELVNVKSRGYLTHPNTNLFKLLKSLEISFEKFADSPTVFEDTYEDFFSKNVNINFPCIEHQTDIITDICTYYLIMRMRQYSYQLNQNNKKQNKVKKKLSKLVST